MRLWWRRDTGPLWAPRWRAFGRLTRQRLHNRWSATLAPLSRVRDRAHRTWLRVRAWHPARQALAATGLGLALLAFLVWLCLDPGSALGLLACGLLGGLIAAVASHLAVRRLRGYQRELLAHLAERLIALRQNPAPHALHELEIGPLRDDLATVTGPLEALAACYRKSLDEVALARVRQEARASAGRGEAYGGTRVGPHAPTHLVVGSSRHRMVGRLAPNLHWMAATPPLLQFLGCSLSHLTARSFLDLVHSEDGPAVQRALHEALKDGEGHNITFRVLLPPAAPPVQPASPSEGNGQPPAAREFHLQMDVMTYYSEAGLPLHLRCHFLDVSDRILTERELRRRTEELSQANARLRQINEDLQRLKESYRDLYHQAPVLYFSLDARGHFVAFNETMLRTLGYPRAALLGQPYQRLLTPASRAAFLQDPTALQRPGELETQWVKRDGTVIEVWVGTTTIKDERGAFVRSRSAARDVTDRKRLANALQAKAEEVGQANSQLRRINQELEDFTYVVSHDLKEPLRTLEAFSNFLAQDYGSVLGADGQEYIGHLTQASRRLGALIDDLLALSRAGRVINTPRAFSWDEVIQTVLGDLHDLIGRQQAVVAVDGPLPPACGDRERVIQLLTNLVSNALKYNKSARPEVVIGPLPPGNGEGGMVALFVRDNGVGIDPIYHEQIFRMFRRLHRRDEVEGTGAGLAICKKIVEAHGGRIWVESQAGAGAQFCFTLPRGGRRETVEDKGWRVEGKDKVAAPSSPSSPSTLHSPPSTRTVPLAAR
jgi:PAS domain S-box-containing protein